MIDCAIISRSIDLIVCITSQDCYCLICMSGFEYKRFVQRVAVGGIEVGFDAVAQNPCKFQNISTLDTILRSMNDESMSIWQTTTQQIQLTMIERDKSNNNLHFTDGCKHSSIRQQGKHNNNSYK